ncbi:ester cyclase [Sorangium sp. So ce1036]|uniref:ester cyclase n=1 Tax=Sorangium sp. So ce1036 TaxID=3133328 RepID=UPI003F075D49
MSIEQNKRVARANFEFYDRGDLDAQISLYDPACRVHLPGRPGPIGRDGFRAFIAGLLAAFGDNTHAIEDQIAEGDRVLTRWRWQGVHRAEFLEMAPTGRLVVLSGMNIDRIADGRIVERWGQFDMLTLLRQLDPGFRSSRPG